MALARWEPMREMTTMREQMNRLVNEFFGRGGGEYGLLGLRLPKSEVAKAKRITISG